MSNGLVSGIVDTKQQRKTKFCVLLLAPLRSVLMSALNKKKFLTAERGRNLSVVLSVAGDYYFP